MSWCFGGLAFWRLCVLVPWWSGSLASPRLAFLVAWCFGVSGVLLPWRLWVVGVLVLWCLVALVFLGPGAPGLLTEE